MQSTDDTPIKESHKSIMARYGLIGFLAVVGIILSYTSFKVTRNWEEDRSLIQLRELTRNYGVAIEIGLLTHLDFLHSITALYDTSPFVSREEFRTFANSLLMRAPGVQALEWIPRISAGERGEYERIARADGLPDFQIKEKNAKGKMVSAGARAEYFPVYYVEPLKGNEQALGFDLASNATRRDALEKARKTGNVVVSGRIKLVQETGDQFAFLAFKPIYQKNYPLNSAELRRKFLLGFALGVFRIGDVVESALAKQAGPSGLDIYVFDDSAPAGNRFLYFHPSRVRQTKVPPESEEKIFGGPHLTFSFPVSDRVWTLVFKPVAGYFAENSTWVPWSALFVGLVFTSILTAYLVSAVGRERQITNLVHERTGALKDSEARFRGAIESLQESFALYDSDDRLSIYNNEFVRLHAGVQDIIRPGMPYEELIRESVKRGKIADAIGREEEFIRDRIVQHRNPSDMVLRELTDGTWYIINEARTPEGGIAVTQTDVTELKDAEKALRESEGRLKSIIDTVPALINVKSIEGRYLLTNRLHSDFFGVEPGAWIGKTSDAISKKHGERVRELDRAIVKTGESVPPYDYRMVDAEGRERDFLTAKNPLRDLSGEIIGIVSTSIDITERKQMEQDFRESEERIRAVVDNVIDGIITIDERGTIHSANPAAERIFEYAEEDLIGQNVNTLAAEPYRSAHDSYLANYLTSGEKKIIGKVRELVGQRRNGQHFPLELAVSELQVGDQRMFVGIVRDITARKEIERMKGEFVSTVSHELRTPLTSIRGSLGLITGGAVGKLPKKARDMIDMAEKNTERVINLVNDILDMEKLESGSMEFRFKAVDLTSLVKHGIEINRGYADQHNIKFLLVESAEGFKVKGDGDRLIQVLANLLSNAAKFSPEGENVEIAVTRRNGTARVSVSDHGLGIPEEFRDNVFAKFTQADSSDTRKAGGTGLGLNISKTIVDKHGGTIGFDTEAGVGTTFYFELPIFDEAAQAAAATPAMVREGSRILICEDDQDIAGFLSILLEQNGFSADVAHTAKQAKELLDQKAYDAMTLDLLLPDQDGISFLRSLREDDRTRDLPIIVVSVVADERRGELQNGDAFGVVDWLAKPIDQARLLAAVSDTLAARPNSQPRLLYVEDDADLLKVVTKLLGDIAEVVAAGTLKEAKKRLLKERFDLVVIDVGLPDGSGLDLLRFLKKNGEAKTPVIIFSAAEVDPEVAAEVHAALVKSKTSNKVLLETIRACIAPSRRRVAKAAP